MSRTRQHAPNQRATPRGEAPTFARLLSSEKPNPEFARCSLMKLSDFSRLSGIPLNVLTAEIEAGRLSTANVDEPLVSPQGMHAWSLRAMGRDQGLDRYLRKVTRTS